MQELTAAFGEAVGLRGAARGADAGSDAGADAASVTLDGRPVSPAQLARMVAGFHQALPAALCATLEMPAGSSYAEGARRLLRLLEAEARGLPATP